MEDITDADYAHIRNLRQPLNHWLVLEKIHRIIKFNQNAWPKPHIDINAGLIKKAKTDFEKKCFKLMNNVVSGKTVKNVRKHRDNKLSATESRRELVSEPNYQTYYNFFNRKFISNRTEKILKYLLISCFV